MPRREDCMIVLENNDPVNSIADSKHGFLCNQENFTESENEEYDAESQKNTKTINTRKWQITLTTKDCAIKKRCQGWQIYPNDTKKAEEVSQLILRLTDSKMNTRAITGSESAKTANAEILCNREDLDDLLGEEDKENEHGHGKIVLREYLKLLTTEQAKISFILKMLTKAVNEHKIFVIYSTFPVLRKPLSKRGWIEKRSIRRMLSMSPEMSEAGLETIEKLLRCPADFIWYTTKRAAVRADERTIVNKFSGCYFTSKVDMCNNLENVSWFYEPGVSNIQFPRCYNVYQPAQIEEFVQDFYITACMGILKWFLFLTSVAGPNATWSSNGSVPIYAILFALERCTDYISVCSHEDIDRRGRVEVSNSDWNQFLTWYDRFLHKREVLQKSDGIDIEELVPYTAKTLKDMIQCRPQSRIDGMRNVWILKPGDKSLGRGIVLKNSLNDILAKLNQSTNECMQYVVQKYIERPLLVHKTKVDVRQWFLITSTQPLVVWMYKDILLRFASKDFTLENFHESIHLCNTTVQLKYRKTLRPNLQIPNELHWNLQKFKEYLKATDRESAWEKLIKPGIKQNLVGALLASQENMVNRKNSFQLYGADFLIMDDLSVWLIEINTNPRLHPPSSSVTEKLYPEVIEDTMKVVIDRRKNKKAPRGKFECIFKQRNPFYGNILGMAATLGIRGKALLSTQTPSRK
ncbi:tubulin glycylase 3A-like isoform X2 [Colletes latitarsis]|uniref:tubulin glycylase 3A-like isoform X2 n=1 Tax=Colletes latitarsis TaxID=2605962 RepID=UPI004036661F